MRGSGHGSLLLGVRVSSAGDHCGVGGSYHRSWLAAYFVQTAAGTDTAADEDQHNDDGDHETNDHGRWTMREISEFAFFSFFLRKRPVIITVIPINTGGQDDTQSQHSDTGQAGRHGHFKIPE